MKSAVHGKIMIAWHRNTRHQLGRRGRMATLLLICCLAMSLIVMPLPFQAGMGERDTLAAPFSRTSGEGPQAATQMAVSCWDRLPASAKTCWCIATSLAETEMPDTAPDPVKASKLSHRVAEWCIMNGPEASAEAPALTSLYLFFSSLLL